MANEKMKQADPAVAATETLEDLAKRAGPIAKNARLDSINIRRVSADLLSDIDLLDDSAVLSYSHVVEHHFTPGTNDGPGALRVQVSFTVRVDAGIEGHQALDLRCTFDVRYGLPTEVPDAVVPNFGAFAKTNTLIHVWPYFREFVQSMTARMGLPPLPLPLFRITDHISRAPKALGKAPKEDSGN